MALGIGDDSDSLSGKPTKTTRWFRSMNNFWLVYDQIHFSGLWMIMNFIP